MICYNIVILMWYDIVSHDNYLLRPLVSFKSLKTLRCFFHPSKYNCTFQTRFFLFWLAIGADVLDVTGQDTHGFGELKYEETHFELSPNQRHYHETVQEISEFLRSEYHALQDVMWMSRGLIATYKSGMPKRYLSLILKLRYQ